LTIVGVTVTTMMVIATVLYSIIDPFGRNPENYVSVDIETPYVGQGVGTGTSVIMHGTKIGDITAISSVSGGGVRVKAELQRATAAGLTDTMGIDFRPANYFGVTGINVIPGDAGQPLRNGVQIRIVPKGNFALQTLLSRLGELSNGVITPRLVDVIDRATRYTDAMTPVIETMFTVTSAVTKVQTVSTEQLLRNTTGISVAFPGFIDALINTGDLFLHSKFVDFNAEQDAKENPYLPLYDDALRERYLASTKFLESDPDRFAQERLAPWLDAAGNDLFGKAGHLLASHPIDLIPAMDMVRILADTVPALVDPQGVADTARELRSRLERMYAGSPEQRALNVRVILDMLPGVAAPAGMAGGPQ
jgi:hypothetical protein